MTHPMTEARFWERLDTSGGALSCWTWTRGRDRDGYGVAKLGGIKRAHRVAWSLVNGPIPDGMFVCHSCDNPPCCNPAHLWLGTAKDNLLDAKRKGRLRRRPDHPWNTNPETRPHGTQFKTARLTDDAVASMRRRVRAGIATLHGLALETGIARSAIAEAVHGSRWSHVAEPPVIGAIKPPRVAAADARYIAQCAVCRIGGRDRARDALGRMIPDPELEGCVLVEGSNWRRAERRQRRAA